MKTGKVCASVSATTSIEAVANIREAEKLADLIEIRFDHLHEGEVPVLIQYLRTNGSSKPLIATYRSSRQGGKASDTPFTRSKFWRELGERFWAVDQEEDIFDAGVPVPNHILSHHDFGPFVDDATEGVFDRLIAQRPDIVKYAYLADDIVDTLPVWKMLKVAGDIPQPAVMIAMGEAGKITRILGPAHGSEWTYGSTGEETAPGQISVEDLIHLFRVHDISKKTKIYGVIGNPVSGSLSPRIHNKAFGAEDIDSVFLPLLVKDLRQFMQRMVRPSSREVDLNFAGFAVTMPHKLSVIKYLDQIDDTAKAIGAVNTVHIDGEKITGHNTDAGGFIKPLLSRLGSLRDARAAIFGAGGAARACLYALKKEGAASTVIARDPRKGEQLAEEFRANFLDLPNAPIGSFDILVNATPLGMSGGGKTPPTFVFDGSGRLKLVYDLVTSAEATPLTMAARAAGLETITGVEMLVAQAEKQFEIWTGRKAPRAAMYQAVGMPAGKEDFRTDRSAL